LRLIARAYGLGAFFFWGGGGTADPCERGLLVRLPRLLSDAVTAGPPAFGVLRPRFDPAPGDVAPGGRARAAGHRGRSPFVALPTSGWFLRHPPKNGRMPYNRFWGQAPTPPPPFPWPRPGPNPLRLTVTTSDQQYRPAETSPAAPVPVEPVVWAGDGRPVAFYVGPAGCNAAQAGRVLRGAPHSGIPALVGSPTPRSPCCSGADSPARDWRAARRFLAGSAARNLQVELHYGPAHNLLVSKLGGLLARSGCSLRPMSIEVIPSDDPTPSATRRTLGWHQPAAWYSSRPSRISATSIRSTNGPPDHPVLPTGPPLWLASWA